MLLNQTSQNWPLLLNSCERVIAHDVIKYHVPNIPHSFKAMIILENFDQMKFICSQLSHKSSIWSGKTGPISYSLLAFFDAISSAFSSSTDHKKVWSKIYKVPDLKVYELNPSGLWGTVCAQILFGRLNMQKVFVLNVQPIDDFSTFVWVRMFSSIRCICVGLLVVDVMKFGDCATPRS